MYSIFNISYHSILNMKLDIDFKLISYHTILNMKLDIDFKLI